MKPLIDIQLSANFSLSEFIHSDTARKKGIYEQYTISPEIFNNIHDLVIYILQPLRFAVGKVVINSGYRCKRLNDIVKGSPTSDHMRGRAADIHVQNINLAVAFLKTRKFDQMVIYKNFIHISYTAPILRNQIIDKRK